MTVEVFTPASTYTVSGVGPYDIGHPYLTSAIVVYVTVNGQEVALSSGDVTVTPGSATVSGSLYLSPTAAAIHAGRVLRIERDTRVEQGWLGVLGEREKGLEAQLDRLTYAVQELDAVDARTLRTRDPIPALVPVANRLLSYDGGKFVSGPTVAEIVGLAAGSPTYAEGGRITPHQFGVIYADGANDDTATIQAAIDAVSALGGGELYFPPGIYGVSNIGTVPSPGRPLALQLKPGVVLCGDGASRATIRRLGTDMGYDLVRGEGTGTFPDVTQTMGVRGMTLDGSAQNRVDGQGGVENQTDGINLYLQNLKDPVARDLIGINSPSFGLRVQFCIGGLNIGNVRCLYGPDVNADGVHFIDCRDMSSHGFELSSEGDDGFVVECQRYDISNLHFTGINVHKSKGRGVLVFRETAGGFTAQRLMENIKIEAVTTECRNPVNNNGQGFEVNTGNATLLNSVFDIQSDSCGRGALVYAGNSSLPGVIKNCTFRLMDSNAVVPATQFTVQSGVAGIFDGNRIEAQIYNPADGGSGIAVTAGTRWSGHVLVNYNPNADKISHALGMNIKVTQSSLFLECKGASANISIADGSSQNTIYLGNLRDATVRDIALAGTAVDTIFVGGTVTGAVLGATSATRFIGTTGANTALFVGDYGVGATSLQLVTNWDDITLRSGLYGTTSATTTGTEPGGYSGFDLVGTMQLDTLNGGTINQTWISAGSQTFWHRRYTGGSWGSWVRMQRVISGATPARTTTGLLPGLSFFDTTLGKPIWRNAANSAWVDATGATV